MSDNQPKVDRDTVARLREFARRLEVAHGHIRATGCRVIEVTRDGDTLTRRVVADGKGEVN
mgnify:CR=1 FL=1